MKSLDPVVNHAEFRFETFRTDTACNKQSQQVCQTCKGFLDLLVLVSIVFLPVKLPCDDVETFIAMSRWFGLWS